MSSEPDPRPFTALLAAFADLRALADALDVPHGTVSAWKHRDSIPERHWRGIAKAAKNLSVRGVTYDALSRASSTKRNPKRAGA